MKTRIIPCFVLFSLCLSFLSACASQSPSLTIENAWGKPSPSVAGAGAFFMVIKNNSSVADKLVAAKSSACAMTELHTTVKKADGTMMMQLVSEGIEIPASGQLELKSGSFHIMCMKMAADQLAAGAKPTLTLTFEKTGQKTVTLEMRQQ